MDFHWFHLRRKKQEPEDKLQGETLEPQPCLHLVLVPRWDNVADMGDETKAVGYRCYACGQSLTVDEAKEAMRKNRSKVE